MTRHVHVRILPGTSLLLVILFAAPLHAQTIGAVTPRSNQQIVSANPFMMMFEAFNAEYERRHTEGSTWGVSGTAFEFSDADYRNISGFYRYYPQQDALSGFYIGGRGGLHHVSADGSSDNFFGLGFEIGYTWLLGPKRNFSVSMGAGATRLFGGSLEGASLTIPTVRLVNVGWSF